MGRMMTYLGQRRPVRTSASDCEIRGGEYVAVDRADYRTAFQVWMPQALQGDARAQTYVGEIFEKGLGRPADFSTAASWYERAVAQGYAPAKVNLSHLLGTGTGVPLDRARSDRLLLEAAGIYGKLPVEVVPDRAAELAALKAEREALQQALRDRQAELAELTRTSIVDRQALAAARAKALQPQTDTTTQRTLEARLKVAENALSIRTTERDSAIAEARRIEADAALRLQAAESRVGELRDAVRLASEQVITLHSKGEEGRKAAQAALDRRTVELNEAVAAVSAAREASESSRIATLQKTQRLEAALVAAAQARDRLSADAETSRKQIESQDIRLKAQADRLAQTERQLAALQAQVLPPGNEPVVELIEPKLLTTRGPALVSVDPTVSHRAIFGQVKVRDALSLLTVNGQRRPVDSAGLFQADIALTAPVTNVQIVAIDGQGRRGQLDFQLHRETIDVDSPASLLPPAIAARIGLGPQFALLIGNARYSMLPGLKTPIEDVEEIGRILRERYGFEVRILHDASRYQMLSALNDLRTKLTAKHDLLVYYAGHGHMVTVEGRERGYWLPVDAEKSNPANWISTLEVTDMLASMDVHKVLLVSDSCYSGLLTRGLVRVPDTSSERARASFLKLIVEPKSRNVLTSGSNMPVLDGGGGTHSIFEKSLARILLENKGPLQGQDLAQALEQVVSLAAQSMNFEQRPQYAPLQLSGHEGGDYVFVPKS